MFFLLQERLRTLYDLVHDIEKDRLKRENVLSDISKTHDKVTQEGKLTTYFQVIFTSFMSYFHTDLF